jgi:uncharacterized membrane protein
MTNREWLVFLFAATPIFEVRGSIPLGLYFGLSPLKTYVLSVIGSILPILPILLGLNYLTEWLRKIPAFDRFFVWLFARTRAKSKLVERFETIGLMLFVAVPLPGTGVWTGCVAAYLFGLSYFEGFIACSLGTMIAGGLVMAASLGLISLF